MSKQWWDEQFIELWDERDSLYDPYITPLVMIQRTSFEQNTHDVAFVETMVVEAKPKWYGRDRG
ncbi:hypothetical protein M5X04_14655 [Paenibacillus alvei]|uniref:Uncharacterized protein n=1 Tax=Paenibacillus alvei TaxID=44250 RepID=A0ABT4EAA6_PAEAL|nr:hypothetical protein [Paenibacillus alvei]MCY9530560.1 hypothetical protein [Paenibacillus alvei]